MLDTSVLVPVWSRGVLQRLAVQTDPLYVPAWSEWIIAETWRVLAWQWRGRVATTDEAEWRALSRAANEMLRYLLRTMVLVSLRDFTGPAPWADLRDPDDGPIWETAVVARAQYVVSHNVRDFPPPVEGRHVHESIEYLTAIEFVENILGQDAALLLAAPLPRGAALRSRRTR